jgi:hypothetical protein
MYKLTTYTYRYRPKVSDSTSMVFLEIDIS